MFPPGILPDGRFTMGLACTYFRELGIYWDLQIDVVSDPDDEPGQMRWTVVDAPSAARVATAPTDSNVFPKVVLAISVLVFVATGIISWRMRQPSPHKELS